MLRVKLQYKSRINRALFSFAFVFLFTGYNIAPVIGAEVADYSALPPFLTTEVTPNVMFMLDNSGSMKHSLYDGGSWRCSSYGNDFNPAKEYYGLFDGAKKYKYDTTIPIDYNGYNGSTASSYTVDVAALPGAFVEDAACTPGAGVNCWNGSFLNWMVTRRIDAARNVMIGGKVESRAGYDYRGSDGDLEWKIVANNERSDNSICKTYASAQTYTPFPDGTKFKITSPANLGATLSTYDPYAKLKAEVSVQAIIVDENSAVIGESGIIENFQANVGLDNWETVTLQHTYTNPIVVATPLSYNGGHPSIVRVVDVQSNQFKIRVEEWEYLDSYHTSEDISYLVIEGGVYTLTGGEKIIAGTQAVNASGWATVDTTSAGFPVGSTPIILSTVTTNTQEDTVTTRLKDIDENSFDIILQEEEDYLNRGDNILHPDETVAYIGLEQGTYFDGGGTFFEVGSQTVNNVDNTVNWSTISFTGASEPNFLASMQTFDDPDPASLRYRNLTSSTVEIFIEEEKSADTEITHGNETVGYVIISKTDQFNLALVVDEEPTGLLHNVVEKVRLGISFYKYNKDTDIYNSERFHGGTLQLSIPHNPFIKGPDVTTGYRTVTTPIKTDITHIVDAIEHYPLVWGTTPLAENYFEVIRYFQQVAPYYDSNINTGDSQASYQVSDTWDPYYYEDPNGDGDTSDAEKINCAQSYILLFTDGYPYRDGYVPDNLTGYDFLDFDDDNNGGDCFDENDLTVRPCENNLNDLSKWAHCDDSGSSATCTGDNRDLRTDLTGEQNLITYTVTFGESTVRPILQETADYGGGIAYAAEDGQELKNQLTNAFTAILSRSSGTSASVISNTRSGEGAIYQSVFFPKKIGKSDDPTVNWVGQIHALLVDAYGNMREDTNNGLTAPDGRNRLDLIADYIIRFNSDGTAGRYEDGDGNQVLQLDTATCPSSTTPPAAVVCYDSLVDTQGLDDLVYLWNTSSWLNEISDANVEFQRSTYLLAGANRYIFTWIDGDGDGVVDATPSEVMDFECLADPSADDLVDPAKIFPYLHLYPSFADIPTEISSLSATDFSNFLIRQSSRQINYIRGSDCADSNDPPDPDNCNTEELEIGGSDIPGSAMRSRQFDYDDDNTLETWRLGDIIYSTPTLVGRPAEAFHLLYRDTSYAPFAAKYNKRRNVIYSGANDGMVHAFNGGFFHSPTKTFCRELNSAYDPYDTDPNNHNACVENMTAGTTTMPELGTELWAYVPFNLLPHLYWLTQTTYNEAYHVYYVDQKPRIFDAQIFEPETECSDTTSEDCIHPNGWGTVMVIGMRFGGGSIVADMDKQSTSCEDGTDCSLSETCGEGTNCSTTEAMCQDGSDCLTKQVCTDDATKACGDASDCTAVCESTGFCSEDATQPCVDASDCIATCGDVDYCDNGDCQVQTCSDLGVATGTCQVHTCADLSATGTCEDRQHPEVTDPTMKSAFMVFDITNPEAKPQLLAELIMPDMGFATNYPTVVVMKDGDHDHDFEDYTSGENQWFLAFGSGPADANGDPGGFDTNDKYVKTVLEDANSLQKAKFYMLDLVKLASENELYTLTDGTPAGVTNQGDMKEGLYSYATLDDNSFVSDPVTVDYDLDYNADVVYFGTISDERSDTTTPDWGGKLRRIVVDDLNDSDDDNDPANWVANNVLIDVGQPITAAPAVGLDDDEMNWVYFGTGRYFVEDDKTDLSLQSYYGIKEPLDSSGHKTWATLTAPNLTPRAGGDLINVTNYQVFTDGTVISGKIGPPPPPSTWAELETEQLTSGGWYLDFFADDAATSLKGERNLGQAALIGGLLSFTTFIPFDDICLASGESDLWALYYKTGTAYFTGVLGETDGFLGGATRTDRAKRSLGEGTDGEYIKGLATSPNVHVGREEGSVVFVQSSTGEIKRIEEENPLSTKSGVLSWKLR